MSGCRRVTIGGHTVARLIRALIEAFLCKAASVSREEIDAFDQGFTGDGEPRPTTESIYWPS
jgi:hypothetical protein